MSVADTVPALSAVELARLERDRAQRAAALWAKPLLTDREVADAVGLPYSSWSAIKAGGDAPRTFRIGRRIFCMTSDLRSWLDQRAESGESA